ncbi:MAG: hypothetical protein SFU57_13775 [Gemmatimonadales bacterium]|nr:hypothetical protein [Gemmatimonadales bacterium]
MIRRSGRCSLTDRMARRLMHDRVRGRTICTHEFLVRGVSIMHLREQSFGIELPEGQRERKGDDATG